jgi:hypothetical protein
MQPGQYKKFNRSKAPPRKRVPGVWKAAFQSKCPVQWMRILIILPFAIAKVIMLKTWLVSSGYHFDKRRYPVQLLFGFQSDKLILHNHCGNIRKFFYRVTDRPRDGGLCVTAPVV